jgi:hypothetical protein
MPLLSCPTFLADEPKLEGYLGACARSSVDASGASV